MTARRTWLWVALTVAVVAIATVASTTLWSWSPQVGGGDYSPDPVGIDLVSFDAMKPLPSDLTSIHCGTASSSVIATAFPWGQVASAHLSGHWCWEGVMQNGTVSNIVGPVVWNTWGSAKWWLGWKYDGVISMVKGHGIHCQTDFGRRYCWEYGYRRAYHQWSFLYKGIAIHHTAWTSLTVRGNGGWAASHTR